MTQSFMQTCCTGSPYQASAPRGAMAFSSVSSVRCYSILSLLDPMYRRVQCSPSLRIQDIALYACSTARLIHCIQLVCADDPAATWRANLLPLSLRILKRACGASGAANPVRPAPYVCRGPALLSRASTPLSSMIRSPPRFDELRQRMLGSAASPLNEDGAVAEQLVLQADRHRRVLSTEQIGTARSTSIQPAFTNCSREHCEGTRIPCSYDNMKGLA